MIALFPGIAFEKYIIYGILIVSFTYNDNNIILLNGFIKKTQKTPKIELERAIKYKEEYQRRFTNGL
ncbi:MAG: type II toxin-antitoxin system RelE/ParE family toxin [Firmicutes bacterium]|nr:type II toxin-antitoxin system RelE/ParE family toxin [Bacillota bacterium]